jgi:hypothetical protein
VARAEYKAVTGADVALAAATAKSVLGWKAGTSFALVLRRVAVFFDGVSATAEPVLVEYCYATFATNAPGTNSTSVTPVQAGGRVLTHGTTAARAWSAEPTVLTVIDEELVHPQMGKVEWVPPGDEWDTALGEGFVIRVTAPAIVNVRASMTAERG